MRRGTSPAAMMGLLALLLLSVFIQVRALPLEVAHVAAVFPEVTPIMLPSVIWGVMAIACWQVAALRGLRILALARDQKFGPSAYGMLRAIVGCLLVFIVLIVAALVALNVLGYGTPGVLLGLIGGGLLALIGASSLALFLGSRPFRGNCSHA